jgi:hypothetical protein
MRMKGVSGFHFGEWYEPEWMKWCGRCREITAPHTHLNPVRTDREAKVQVIYTGFGPDEPAVADRVVKIAVVDVIADKVGYR